MMTRAEHVRWCKERAREYLDQGDLLNAITSMLSDLSKHPETRSLSEGPLAGYGIIFATKNANDARKFIEGFTE